MTKDDSASRRVHTSRNMGGGRQRQWLWLWGGETAAAEKDVRVEGGARALEEKEIENDGGAGKGVLRKEEGRVVRDWVACGGRVGG